MDDHIGMCACVEKIFLFKVDQDAKIFKQQKKNRFSQTLNELYFY